MYTTYRLSGVPAIIIPSSLLLTDSYSESGVPGTIIPSSFFNGNGNRENSKWHVSSKMAVFSKDVPNSLFEINCKFNTNTTIKLPLF